jgi:hypothetical protein
VTVFQIEFFSMQLMHNDVEFSACKIFAIDESLLYSVKQSDFSKHHS